MSKNRLLCSTLLVSAMLCGPALAQVEVPPPAPPAEPTGVDELIVTGTRLRIPDYTSPNPVISSSAQQIEESGDASIVEFLMDTPALVGSTDDAQAADQTTQSMVGLNLPNLRNLGEDRTLVLVNGRRHVASLVGTSAVDINTIPIDLIERVDVLTGGSSAVYGAEGVSGVINFILKDNFDDTVVRAQYGDSIEGGGGTAFTSLTAGRNFAQDRGNVVVSGEYYNRQDLDFNERDYTRIGVRRTLVANPDDTGDDDGIPGYILSDNLRYPDSSLGGSLITNLSLGGLPIFLYDGELFDHGVNPGAFPTIGGSGSLLDLYNDDLLPGSKRWNISTIGHFDLTPRLRLFGEYKFVKSTADFTGQPSYDYGLLLPIDPGNPNNMSPFIPQVAIDDAIANAADFDEIETLVPPSYAPNFLLVARDNFDLGRVGVDIQRETQRAVAGLSGDFSDNLRFEASYVWGQTEEQVHKTNVRIHERYYAATDVVTDSNGNLRCRSDLDQPGDPVSIPSGDVFSQFPFDPTTFGTTFTPGPNSGCTPVNILGLNQFSPEAMDWINTKIEDKATIEQEVANAFITGSTDGFFEVPTGGPIYFVLGGEYRKESSSFRPDPIKVLSDSLGTPLTLDGQASVTEGEFDVSELFTEVEIPLVMDAPGAKLISVQGAYRYSDYSTAGKANTWNVAGRWQFNDSVMLRGTVARAVRAPNVNELFRGRDQTFETIVDPCSYENFDQAGSDELNAIRLANCTADFAPLGLTIGPDDEEDFRDNSTEATQGFLAGNLLLKPETADTTTLGLVFTPTGVPGLSFSFDFYNIKIDDAIASYSAQSIVDNCYDLPRPNQFCDLITRQGNGDPFPGRIQGFDQVPGNIASLETKGIDFSARYHLDPANFDYTKDIGTFDFALSGNFLNKLASVEAEGAEPSLADGDGENADDDRAPTFQATLDMTWNYHNWSVNYGINYFNETRRLGRQTRIDDPEIYPVEAYDYAARNEHDVRVAYTFEDKGVELYAGMNNVFNQKPEYQDYIWPVSPLGRFAFVGLKVTR